MSRYCRHCGGSVPYDAPSPICGQCACLPVAERGRRWPAPVQPLAATPTPSVEASALEALEYPIRAETQRRLDRQWEAFRLELTIRPFPSWAFQRD